MTRYGESLIFEAIWRRNSKATANTDISTDLPEPELADKATPAHSQKHQLWMSEPLEWSRIISALSLDILSLWRHNCAILT